MCIGIPRKVVSIENNEIITEWNGELRSADASLVKNVKVNDYVIVANKVVVEKLSNEQAFELIKIFKKML